MVVVNFFKMVWGGYPGISHTGGERMHFQTPFKQIHVGHKRFSSGWVFLEKHRFPLVLGWQSVKAFCESFCVKVCNFDWWHFLWSNRKHFKELQHNFSHVNKTVWMGNQATSLKEWSQRDAKYLAMLRGCLLEMAKTSCRQLPLSASVCVSVYWWPVLLHPWVVD